MNSCLIKIILFVSLLMMLTTSNLTPRALAQTNAPTEPTPTPIGEILKLDFIIPGVGSGSANFEPVHKTRHVTIDFYAPDANSLDAAVKPVASISAQGTFDADPLSPTYGRYINKNIDLGTMVPSGTYQISFKEDRSLAKLVKEKEQAVGGKIFIISKNINQPIIVTDQTIIIGDIYPTSGSDNIMDIKDYNALVGCFGSKSDSSGCDDKMVADLDDNGVVDGTDYNIMFSSFRKLLEMGVPVPSLFAKPTKPVAKSTPKPAKRPVAIPAKTSRNGNILPLILFIFILIGAGVGLFFFLRKRGQKKSEEKTTDAGQAAPLETENQPAAKDEQIDKEFYVKKQTDDPEHKRLVLTLTDDDGPTLGYYAGTEVKEGFANVKGIKKIDGNKVYIEVSSITPEEPTEATS